MLDITAVVCSLALLSIIALFLNVFCIHILRLNTKFHEKPSTAFVLNLLLIHVFQAIFVFPLYAAKKIKVENCFWQQLFSNSFLVSYIISYYGTCFSVLNISLDRFLATYLLSSYKIYVSFKNVVVVIVVTWIYVLLLCSIPFIPQTVIVPGGYSNNNQSIHDNSTAYLNRTAANSLQLGLLFHNSSLYSEVPNSLTKTITSLPYFYNSSNDSSNLMEKNLVGNVFNISGIDTQSLHASSEKKCQKWVYGYRPQPEWTVFMVFFNSAVPLMIIVVSYVYIVLRLKRLQPTSKITGNRREILKMREFRKYQQVTRLTQVLSVTYTICWSPSIIYYTILSVCKHKCFPENWNDSFIEKHLVYVIKYLLFINSLFSPLIYCFHHPEMQRRISRMKRTFAIQPEPNRQKAYTLSIHNIELSSLGLPKESQWKQI